MVGLKRKKKKTEDTYAKRAAVVLHNSFNWTSWVNWAEDIPGNLSTVLIAVLQAVFDVALVQVCNNWNSRFHRTQPAKKGKGPEN